MKIYQPVIRVLNDDGVEKKWHSKFVFTEQGPAVEHLDAWVIEMKKVFTIIDKEVYPLIMSG